MKKHTLLVLFTTFLFVENCLAEVVGISTRNQLLQQLQLSLNMTVEEMDLPASLVSKLPLENDVTEIKATFLSTWRQISFLACLKAVALKKVKQSLTSQDVKQEFVATLTESSWGRRATNDEIDQIIQVTENSLSNQTETQKKVAVLCSSTLSSPYVYLIYTPIEVIQ